MTAPISRLGALAITPRPLAAYRDMFLLTEEDLLAGPILDCPAGASPFGAQVRAVGGTVVSVDPAYQAREQVVDQARADLDRIIRWQKSNPAGFNWDYLGSPDAVRRDWEQAIDEFAADYGLDAEWYVAAALPALPFPDGAFRLTVSGFLLFVYPEVLDLVAHLRGLLELVRITSGEVRTYPLHDTAGVRYPELRELRGALADHGVRSEIRSTGCAHQPQPGSDELLACWRP